MSGWDVLRLKSRGGTDKGLPRCRRCGKVRALDPCRDCATPEEAAAYPPLPEQEPAS